MATRFTPVLYRGWGGGLNDSKNLLTLRENELSDIRNFYVARDGHLKRRAGQNGVYATFTGGDVVHGLHQTRIDSTRYLLTTAGTKLYRDNGTDITGTAVITAGQNNPVKMVTFKNTVIGVQSDTTAGINKPFKWTGSGNAALLDASGNPPSRAVAIAPWKQRLFFGNVTYEGTVYQDGVIWTEFDTIDRIIGQDIKRLDAGSGQYTTSFLRLGRGPEPDLDVMLIFQDRSLHYSQHRSIGGDPIINSAFTFGNISDSVGCPAPLGPVEVDGVAYWPSYRGFYRMGPDLVIDDRNYIGKTIEIFWDTIPRNRIPHIKGDYLEDLGQIWWAVSSGTGQTTNNRVVVFDTVFQRFVGIHDGINANVMTAIIDANLNRKLYTSDYSNQIIYEQNNGLDDDGTGFTAYLKTGYLDLRSPGVMKSFRKVLMELGTDTEKLGSVYTYLYNLSGTQVQSLSVGTAGTPLDQFQLDVDFLVGSDYSQFSGRASGRARYVQLEYRTTQQKAFDCYGLGYYVMGRRSGPGVTR